LFEPTDKMREHALKIRDAAPIALANIADHPAAR
jgi:hypothetical protein